MIFRGPTKISVFTTDSSKLHTYTLSIHPTTTSTCTLLSLTSSRSRNNLHQLTSNDSLSGAVVNHLEFVDHLVGVLAGIVHGVAAGSLLDCVAFGKRPVDVVGKGVFFQVLDDFVVDFELGEVG